MTVTSQAYVDRAGMDPELPRSITLGEARELALEVLRTAKQHLKDERTEDGRFLANITEGGK